MVYHKTTNVATVDMLRFSNLFLTYILIPLMDTFQCSCLFQSRGSAPRRDVENRIVTTFA